VSLKKGTPGNGGQVRADSFSYTSVAPGLKGWFTAWLAGPIYWCQVHEHTKKTPGTKPCLEWMTDNELRCPRCRPQFVPTWVGYVPLYREQDHKPVIVIVHESVMDLLAGLSYPDGVIVGRVDENSSVFVRRCDTAAMFKTDNAARRRPVDVTRDLLTMWRIPELDRWVLEKRRGNSVTKQTEVENVSDTGRLNEVGTEPPAHDNRLLGDSFMGALDPETQKEIVRRRNEAFVSQNGNGRHKKKTE